MHLNLYMKSDSQKYAKLIYSKDYLQVSPYDLDATLKDKPQQDREDKCIEFVCDLFNADFI